MKVISRFLILTLALALLLPFLPQSRAASASTVNAMSYNLKNTNYNFGGVSSMVDNYGADIVGMQEVNSLQYLGMNAAMKLAGYDCTLGKSSGSDGITESDEYLPIYFKSSKYSEFAHGTLWLSDTPTEKSKFSDSNYYRVVTWGCYQIIGTEDYILVFNTHLDFGVDLQIRQMNVILNAIREKTEHYWKAKDHVILMGDMNCANTSTTSEYIEGDHTYKNVPNTYTMQLLDESRQIASSTTPNAHGNYYTQPTSGPTMDLDHIYVSHKGFYCDSYAVLDNDAGSDHLPILAKLRFKTLSDHTFTYRWLSDGMHRRTCIHCGTIYDQACRYVGDYCTLCGGSKRQQSFSLVKSPEDVGTGRYLMLIQGTGSYTGNYPYYAASVYGDSGFNAMQTQGMSYSSLPEQITLSQAQIPALVWYFSGTNQGLTIGDAVGNTLNHAEWEMYLNKDGASKWVPEFNSASGYFAMKEGSNFYLTIRTDLDTVGKIESPGPLFGCVWGTSTGNYKIYLYKDDSYCTHKNVSTEVFAPTCTQQGYTARTCKDCGYVDTTNILPALGHQYQSTTFPPTEESYGYTLHVCSNCEDTYADNYVDPIYTISFVVPAGMTAPAPIKNDSTIVLPDVSGEAYLAPEGSTFLGWVTQTYDNICSTEVTPYVFRAGSKVTILDNVSVYALFSYHKGNGQVERTFTLYDGSRSLQIGDHVILVATDYNYAMSSVQGSTNRAGVAIQKDTENNTITLTTEPVGIFTLNWGVSGSAQTTQISLQDSNGYLRMSDSSANTLTASATLDASASWKLGRYSDNSVALTSQGASSNNVIRYRSSNNTFACFNSGTESYIQIYYLSYTYDPTLYFTTYFSLENCAHPKTHVTGVLEADCTKEGYTGDRVCLYCEALLKQGKTVAPLGHSYSYRPAEQGQHSYVCLKCGLSGTEACDHTNGGCICGSVPDGPAKDAALSFTNHSLSLASSIRVNFIVPKSALTYDSYRIVIEKECYDVMGSLIGTEVYEYQSFEPYNNNYSKVVMDRISATEMTALLHATIYGYKNGEEFVGNTDSYSVERYALKQMQNELSTQKLRTLCADLLNYGAAAQEYKSYNLSDLANQSMTAEMRAYASDPDSLQLQNIKSHSNAPGASTVILGNALIMEDKVELLFILSSAKGVTVEVSFTDNRGVKQVRNYSEKDLELYREESGYYSLKVDDLDADQMSTSVTAKLSVNGKWQSTRTYSIESYCASYAGNGTALGDCCTMMMLYGNSAKAYFL